MTENGKIFSLSIFAFFSLGLFINLFQPAMENFLIKNSLKAKPLLFLASLNQQYLELEREKQWQIKPPENCLIEGKSALILEIDERGEETILFQKNVEEKMAIASLTKLMTALIALDFYPKDYQIIVSKRAVEQPEQTGDLKAGENLTIENLVYLILVESSNDAAFSLTEPMGQEGFIALMNLKAKDLGMLKTRFYNANGLDLKKQNEPFNFSTALDLTKLAKHLLWLSKTEKGSAFILKISAQTETALYLNNGAFHHLMKNTNILLAENPEIIGGKTGFTEKAGGCLLTISQKPERGKTRINIILNSTDRFADMRKLLTCASFK